MDEYQIEAAWLPKNTSASITGEGLSSLGEISSIDDAALEKIWTAGQCVSGVWLFSNDLPYMVLSNFGDKLVFFDGETVDSYVWGAEGVCLT